jgi:hypothetical protein
LLHSGEFEHFRDLEVPLAFGAVCEPLESEVPKTDWAALAVERFPPDILSTVKGVGIRGAEAVSTSALSAVERFEIAVRVLLAGDGPVSVVTQIPAAV